MRVKTIRPFVDRFTGVRYDLGEVYTSSDSKRIEELEERGFVEKFKETEAKPRKSNVKKNGGVKDDSSQ